MVTQQMIPFAGVQWSLLYTCSLPGLWWFPLFLVGANRSWGFGEAVFLWSRKASSFLALRYPCTFFGKQLKSTHVWRPRVCEREKCLYVNGHVDGWIQEQMEQGALVQDNCSNARRPKRFASLVFTFLGLPFSSIRTTQKQHQKGNPPQTSASKGITEEGICIKELFPFQFSFLSFKIWDCANLSSRLRFPFCLQKSFMVFLWPPFSSGLPIHGRVLSPIEGQFSSDPLPFIYFFKSFTFAWN